MLAWGCNMHLPLPSNCMMPRAEQPGATRAVNSIVLHIHLLSIFISDVEQDGYTSWLAKHTVI